MLIGTEWLMKDDGASERQDESAKSAKDLILKQNLHDINLYKKAILELIDNNSLAVHFQPVFSTIDGAVYGYEALTRFNSMNNLFTDTGSLFMKASEAGTVSDLDSVCLRNAVRDAALLGIKEKDAYLFINISPETLVNSVCGIDVVSETTGTWGLPKEKIVFDVSERSAINDEVLFRSAVDRFRKEGYKIAIDDLGGGPGGLKAIALIEPDFVKIDRHFISDIDKSMIKFNLVESVATACNRIGIKVIAEGVERQEELDVVINMGVELLQGYLLGKPSPSLAVNETMFVTVGRARAAREWVDGNAGRHFNVIGSICRKVDPISPAAPFVTAVKRFTTDSELRGLPVVENGTVVGMLHRIRFTEQQILGRFGYGMYLNSYKTIGAVMERNFLVVEANAPLERVAQKVNAREAAFLYDDLIVTEYGRYRGSVAVGDLLEAITERSISTARNANPLTGLPGNVSIQKEIEKRLFQNMQFDVCYIDLDHFKPYNDCYGFERGDIVIRTLAGIISNAVKSVDKDIMNFIGHIGGDDFIVIARPQTSESIAEKIVSEFLLKLSDFHGTDDFERGDYTSRNRKGETQKYDLLSISIGIVSTKIRKIDSYAQLASIASDVKKIAKMQRGCSIVRDRRIG